MSKLCEGCTTEFKSYDRKKAVSAADSILRKYPFWELEEYSDCRPIAFMATTKIIRGAGHDYGCRLGSRSILKNLVNHAQ